MTLRLALDAELNAKLELLTTLFYARIHCKFCAVSQKTKISSEKSEV